jgi:hypothetical protein
MKLIIHLETEQAVEHTQLIMVSYPRRKRMKSGRCYKQRPLTNCKSKLGRHGQSVANPKRRHECTSATVMPLIHGNSWIESEATSACWTNRPHGRDLNNSDTDLSWMMLLTSLALNPSNFCMSNESVFPGCQYTCRNISCSDGKSLLCNWWVLPVYENPCKPVFRFSCQEHQGGISHSTG